MPGPLTEGSEATRRVAMLSAAARKRTAARRRRQDADRYEADADALTAAADEIARRLAAENGAA